MSTYIDRKPLLADWESARGAKVLLFATGDRGGWETQLHPEVLPFFSQHLDALGDVEKISLILYTQGGSTLAAWSIVNLIRQFCSHLEVIVPSRAHSAGTLICLGADSIMMTKQATLGPIDPSVNGPLNPEVPGAPPNVRFPVSVEAINGFMAFAEEVGGITDSADRKDVLLRLADRIHPLVLGEAFRSRAQIRMLARRLLTRHLGEQEDKIKKILDFLCSESGSHDYTIYRQEARDDLALTVEKPDAALYLKLKSIYDSFAAEMELGLPYNPEAVLGSNAQVPYRYCRALLESVHHGSHAFVSEGILTRQQVSIPGGMSQLAVADRRTFEGWKFTHA